MDRPGGMETKISAARSRCHLGIDLMILQKGAILIGPGLLQIMIEDRGMCFRAIGQRAAGNRHRCWSEGESEIFVRQILVSDTRRGDRIDLHHPMRKLHGWRRGPRFVRQCPDIGIDVRCPIPICTSGCILQFYPSQNDIPISIIYNIFIITYSTVHKSHPLKNKKSDLYRSLAF
ncbi:hypothetical protein D3C81_1369000 [compost metagenome]